METTVRGQLRGQNHCVTCFRATGLASCAAVGEAVWVDSDVKTKLSANLCQSTAAESHVQKAARVSLPTPSAALTRVEQAASPQRASGSGQGTGCYSLLRLTSDKPRSISSPHTQKGMFSGRPHTSSMCGVTERPTGGHIGTWDSLTDTHNQEATRMT